MINDTSSLEQLLALVNDKDKYDKFAKDIKKQLDAVTKERELIGNAKDIERLHEQAEEDADHAKVVLDRAKKMADGIEKQAIAELKKEQNETDARKAMVDRDEKTFKDHEKAITKELSSLRVKLNTKEKQVVKRESDAKHLQDKCNKLITEFTRKEEILTEALNRV